MAIKAISQFDAATPASNDKILFEQNGEGKSATLADLPVSTKTQTALDTKVNTANVLSLEEIMATTDLTGKVASAGSVKNKASAITGRFGPNITFAVPIPNALLQVLFIDTFSSCGLYIIRYESSSSLFILPVKPIDNMTVTASNGSVMLTNNQSFGGDYLVIF